MQRYNLRTACFSSRISKLNHPAQMAIREMPKFDELRNHIDMTVTYEGLRIELTESAAGMFFDSGSAKMSPGGGDLVALLAQESGKLPNKIAIEGHTDSKAYPPAVLYTNWELSTDRANAARRLMQSHGLGNDQVTQVRGFADQRLRKPDTPQDPSNRRITLIVQYLSKPGLEEPPAPGEQDKSEGAKDKPASESSREYSETVAKLPGVAAYRRSFTYNPCIYKPVFAPAHLKFWGPATVSRSDFCRSSGFNSQGLVCVVLDAPRPL